MQKTAALLSLLAPASALLLKDAAMVMSHDAATGYMNGSFVIAEWTKTQEGTWEDQVKCGARSFDVRPKLDGSKLIMHHGAISVGKPFGDAMEDLVRGSAHVKGEVLIARISHYDGDGCEAAARKKVADLKIKSLDCSALSTLTYQDAVKQGLQPNGGSVLAFFGCSDSNYDSKITCYGPFEYAESVAEQQKLGKAQLKCGCYDEGSSEKSAFKSMETYINKTVARTSGQFWQVQGLWQESTKTVVEGTLCGSSLVKDTQRSKLNSWLLPRIAGWPRLSFLEVNDVCNPDGSGVKLAAACKARNAAAMALEK